MHTIITTKTVREIVEMRRNDFLKVNPEYQRGAVWDRKQKQLLIDSILRGYPIPLFYFHFKKSKAGGLSSERFEIIDGQQRIDAICGYASLEFPLPDPQKEKTGLPKFLIGQECPWAARQFDQLSRDDSERFLNTPLSIVTIEPDQESEIRDLFIRLQAGLPLSSQEKRDAWPGEFSQFVISLAGKQSKAEGHDFFRSVMRLGTAGRSDPKRRLVCAQMYMLLDTRKDHGLSTFCNLGSQDIDNFYHYHVDFDKSCETARRFRRILDLAHEVLGDGKRPPIKNHLAIHLFLLIDSLMDDFESDWKRRFPEAIDKFIEKLVEASKNKATSNEFWRKYGTKARISSANRDTVQVRHQFFVEKMLENMNERSPLRRKDPVRAFTTYERELLYYSGKKNCAICGKVVDWDDAEADHVEPHALGGITTLSNARLVHRQCHLRGKQALDAVQPSHDSHPRGPLWESDGPPSFTEDDEGGEDVEWMEGLSKKEAGNESRATFLALLAEKGIELEHMSGVEYRDQNGRRIVIPSANKPGRQGGFWLGAAEKYFRGPSETALILLCRAGERFLPFLLSPEATRSAVSRLKPKGDDQYKFNVARTNSGRYELRLDDGDAMDLTPYRDNFGQLA